MTTVAERYDAFLFDLDGVLYRDDEPIPGAADAVARLRAMGKRLAFVTNNSTRSPHTVATGLSGMGIDALPEEIETSALATADLLAKDGVRSAFVVGESGLRDALEGRGVELRDGDADGVGPVDAVVVGLDRDADYARLCTASLLVERGARLVATNADASLPAPDGDRPGAGALLAAIETTTGASADVVGKPHPTILLAALERAGGGRPLVIGDRLETDVAGAAELGWDSFLVMTGISSREDVDGSPARPTYVAADLSGLFTLE